MEIIFNPNSNELKNLIPEEIYEAIERATVPKSTFSFKGLNPGFTTEETCPLKTLSCETKRRLLDGFDVPVEDMIDRVIFHEPATIVFWIDGTKTTVKTQNGEKYDPEKGLAMCVVKYLSGNTSKYYQIFKKYCPEEEKNIAET